MRMHDWTRVPAGIFHNFHHDWITTVKHTLNSGLLPKDYYALSEQVAAGFGPDVLTLQDQPADSSDAGGTATLVRPKSKFFAEHPRGIRQRRKSLVAVRHVSNDRVVAMIELVSPGNKSSANAFRALIDKACELLDQRIHLMLLDPFPPGPRDPNGIHSAIWEELCSEKFELPAGEPLTFVAYEAGDFQRAYIETFAVGDPLPDMPLFLAPDFYIMVPLAATYQAAWQTVPPRWQRVIETQP